MDLIQTQIKESYRRRRIRRHRSSPISQVSPYGQDNTSYVSTSTSLEYAIPSSSRQRRLSSQWSPQEMANTTPEDGQHSSTIDSSHEFPNGATVYASLNCNIGSEATTTSIALSETEVNLVMYYFDHVFSRFAPWFKYSAAHDGRGWLLNLFLRSRPLLMAAICISACDKAQFLLGPLSHVPQPYHALEMQNLQAVASVRDHLDQLTLRSGLGQMAAAVEALACIIHLMFFEVCGFRNLSRCFHLQFVLVSLLFAACLLTSLHLSPLANK
ncbi:hypothetical protein LTR84_000206 [Exophiala bonariae]|uniref:Transcription factor domain-containing protein n=1 Tax=Exophiala bonariae TaxID=1690606 RepID=A0AAV9NTM5_9EURO|nr:hypothetical protein LTR84_000206 [Exophiala bonariae]